MRLLFIVLSYPKNGLYFEHYWVSKNDYNWKYMHKKFQYNEKDRKL
jgi:hypothetical protein